MQRCLPSAPTPPSFITTAAGPRLFCSDPQAGATARQVSVA